MRHRNATDFLQADLVFCHSLNWFIRVNSLLVEILECSVYKIISLENMNNVTFSLPVWMPFLSFSCLVSLGEISIAVLSRDVKTR